MFAQVNGSVLVGGIDRPPRESLEQWLARRRRELTVLDSQAEHAPSPPKGELAEPGRAVAVRPDSAEPLQQSMTSEQEH